MKHRKIAEPVRGKIFQEVVEKKSNVSGSGIEWRIHTHTHTGRRDQGEKQGSWELGREVWWGQSHTALKHRELRTGEVWPSVAAITDNQCHMPDSTGTQSDQRPKDGLFWERENANHQPPDWPALKEGPKEKL